MMNITFKNNNKVKYQELCFGDIFTYDGLVYMLTNQQKEDTKGGLKSVNLANGYMEVFGSEVMVTKFENAECVLK